MGRNEGALELLLYSVTRLPSFLMPEQRFDLIILILCLCVELVDMHSPMRKQLMDDGEPTHRYLHELIEILFTRLEEAQKTDAETDEMLDAHQNAGTMTEAMQETLLERGNVS